MKYIMLKYRLDSEALCFNTLHSLRGGASYASMSLWTNQAVSRSLAYR